MTKRNVHRISYLTAAPHPAAGGFKNSVSLDQ